MKGCTIHIGTKHAAVSPRPGIPHYHTGRSCQGYRMAVKIHSHLEPGSGGPAKIQRHLDKGLSEGKRKAGTARVGLQCV